MDLPSARELELEVLLRERDTQITELSDELTTLRRYLAKQPGPSTAEPISFPPAVLSILLPQLSAARNTKSAGSATVAGGLNQRLRQLQDENNELYNLLKSSETGQLKDEVRGLRRVVAKLEFALKESHQVISSLSSDIEKTHDALVNSSTQRGHLSVKSASHSPRNSHHPEHALDVGGGASQNSNNATSSKLPPTGPRLHKRPRLSEPRASSPLPAKPHLKYSPHPSQSHIHGHGHVQSHERRTASKSNTSNAMEVDQTSVSAGSRGDGQRDRDRTREREKNNKERERTNREREKNNLEDWDRDSNSNTNYKGKPGANTSGSRRNGNHTTGRSGGGGRRKGNGNTDPTSNRTLQERLGM